MSDLTGNPEDRISREASQFRPSFLKMHYILQAESETLYKLFLRLNAIVYILSPLFTHENRILFEPLESEPDTKLVLDIKNSKESYAHKLINYETS